jgi:hypothetical protein
MTPGVVRDRFIGLVAQWWEVGGGIADGPMGEELLGPAEGLSMTLDT